MKKKSHQLDNLEQIRSYLMDLLARREYSRAQLERKLKSRTDQDDLVSQALDQFAEAGYQSDLRFAQSHMRQRLEQGQGIKKVLYELAQKGIDRHLLTELVEEQNIDSEAQALRYLRKKYGMHPPTDERERARWMRHLAGRGFSFSDIDFALRHQTDSDFS